MTTDVLTRDELDRLVADVLNRHGLTREEFMARGRADELDGDELRDLWLMTKAVIRP